MDAAMTTYSYKVINQLALRAEDICIQDIAHALALCNRFAGHTHVPISVAQHSVYVSRLVPPEHRLQGLLHDASEAYLGDVVKWLKQTPEFAGYRAAEARTQATIFARFGCAIDLAPEVEAADKLMVRLEAQEGYNGRMVIPHPLYPRITYEERLTVGHWEPWDWRIAEALFLARFEELVS